MGVRATTFYLFGFEDEVPTGASGWASFSTANLKKSHCISWTQYKTHFSSPQRRRTKKNQVTRPLCLHVLCWEIHLSVFHILYLNVIQNGSFVSGMYRERRIVSPQSPPDGPSSCARTMATSETRDGSVCSFTIHNPVAFISEELSSPIMLILSLHFDVRSQRFVFEWHLP